MLSNAEKRCRYDQLGPDQYDAASSQGGFSRGFEGVSFVVYTLYVVYLAVILIWWFGKFLLVRQI